MIFPQGCVLTIQGHDFLIVGHSKLGHILNRFTDIAGFVFMTLPYSTLILRVFPLDKIAHVGVSPSRSLMLISCETIFEVQKPM